MECADFVYNITMKIQTAGENLTNHKKFTYIKELIHIFLQQKAYTQIDVPVLSPVLIPESYLEVFETEFKYQKENNKLYLTPSPELFLKRAIAAGAGSVYALTKSFRNSEPHTTRHSPEFTMLEFYKVDADYMELADDVLHLFQFIAEKLYQRKTIEFRGTIIHLDSWEKITVAQAFMKYAGISDIFSETEFLIQAEKKGYAVKGFSYTDVWSQIYTQDVEPNLGKNGRPTLIYEYPKELAAMVNFNSKKNVAERFEVYIEGVELGNCGNETTADTNWIEFETRLKNEELLRQKEGRTMYPADTEFLNILKQLPRCTGIAIGVERLAMVLLNSDSIEKLNLLLLTDY